MRHYENVFEPIKILHVVSCLDRGGVEMRAMEMLRHLARISHQPGTSQNSVPLLRRSSAGGNPKHCLPLRQAVAHRDEKCGLDRRRYRFHFCTLSGRRGEFDDEVRSLGGEVFPLRRCLVRFPHRFQALLKQQRYDVVQSQVFYYSGVILRMAARCGVDIRVAQLHTMPVRRRANPGRKFIWRMMRRWIDTHATHIVGVSEGVMAAAWRPDWRSDSRCRVVYNGVAASDFDTADVGREVCREFGFSVGDPLCIHVGRFSTPKNHLRLISIFAEILKHRPAARLLIVGGRGLAIERRVRRRVAECGFADRVVFCGERDDVPRLLTASDLLLFPSLWEGLPGAVQEACAVGTPVLASDLPAVREIAERLPGVRALSLNVPDRQWGDAADAMLRDRHLLPSREEARRTFADSEFTIQRCANTFCRIWRGAPAEEPAADTPNVREKEKAA